MRAFVSSLIAVVVLTAFFGLLYPAVMTGFASVAFPDKAGGSLIKQGDRVVGSSLAAQEFKADKYFHERPSATSPAYNAGATTFANLGPTNPQLAKNVDAAIAAILELEGPYNPGLTKGDIPVDAVTTSASGIDPAHLARLRPAAGSPRSQRSATCRSRPSRT